MNISQTSKNQEKRTFANLKQWKLNEVDEQMSETKEKEANRAEKRNDRIRRIP